MEEGSAEYNEIKLILDKADACKALQLPLTKATAVNDLDANIDVLERNMIVLPLPHRWEITSRKLVALALQGSTDQLQSWAAAL